MAPAKSLMVAFVALAHVSRACAGAITPREGPGGLAHDTGALAREPGSQDTGGLARIPGTRERDTSGLTRDTGRSEGLDDILVGIGYFAGWWKGPGDKWYEPWNQSVDWRPMYPGRVPLLGDYNVQSTMDAEIATMADNGVDFLQILYYDPFPKPRAPGAQFLNRGVSNFIASPNAHRLRFHITLCNSLPTFGVTNDTEWEELIAAWMPAFKHPSYLRIDNRLVFRVISAPAFFISANHSSATVTRRLDGLRAAVKAETGLDMVISAGLACMGTLHNVSVVGYAKYDYTSLYACVPTNTTAFKPGQVYPWSDLAEFVRDSRLKHAAIDGVPFEPLVMSGWDPRPWREPRPSFTFPTAAEFEAELLQVKADLHNESLTLGIPRRDGTLQKAFNVYSWNEFGEGGIVAPSKGWQYSRLESLKKIFKD